MSIFRRKGLRKSIWGEKNLAIIIELKIAGSNESLKAAAVAGLNQIDNKRYADEFRYLDVIKAGISFYKKRCYIQIEPE